MEKINTPLGELQELLIEKSDGWDQTISFDHGYMCGIRDALYLLNTLRQTEREVIEKARISGLPMPQMWHMSKEENAKKWFNENFKSYE